MISKEIQAYISNREHFALKQATDKAVSQVLHTARKEIIDLIAANPENFQIPAEAKLVPQKLNKGNNHLGFPYMVSDFPCVFSIDHIFSFRIMVWYGKSITVSLMLSGRFQENYKVPKQIMRMDEYKVKRSSSLWDKNTQDEVRFLGSKDKKHDRGHSLRINREFHIELIASLPEIAKTCFEDLLQSKR